MHFRILFFSFPITIWSEGLLQWPKLITWLSSCFNASKFFWWTSSCLDKSVMIFSFSSISSCIFLLSLARLSSKLATLVFSALQASLSSSKAASSSLTEMNHCVGIRLDRTMVRSLLVRSLQPKVRSLYSKVRSLHQISYFAINVRYFVSCCNVKYWLAMIFKVHRWWCVLRRFEYILFTLSFRLTTYIFIYMYRWLEV